MFLRSAPVGRSGQAHAMACRVRHAGAPHRIFLSNANFFFPTLLGQTEPDSIMNPDVFAMDNLCYKPYTPRQDNCLMIAAVGAAAAVVFMLLTKPSSPAYLPVAGNFASSMLSKISGSALSPPLPKEITSHDGHGIKHVAGPDAPKQAASVLTSSGSEAVVMIYAPWCPHCKTAMPDFAKLSKEHPGTLFVLIDAESLPGEAFSGPNALVQLEHFPTLVRKEKGKEPVKVSSMQEAIPAKTDSKTEPAKVPAAKTFMDSLWDGI